MTHGRNIQIQSCLGVLDKIKDDKSMYVYQFQARDVHQDLEKWKVAQGDPGCQRHIKHHIILFFLQMLPEGWQDQPVSQKKVLEDSRAQRGCLLNLSPNPSFFLFFFS